VRANKRRRETSEKLPHVAAPTNFATGHHFIKRGRFAMSYAEAKQIAFLRLELRSCWERADYAGASVALASLRQMSSNDNELQAEVKRWAVKIDVAA
jgi:hypothetical protein